MMQGAKLLDEAMGRDDLALASGAGVVLHESPYKNWGFFSFARGAYNK
nr:hypothetical protein [Paenibacillus sp. HGH0039]